MNTNYWLYECKYLWIAKPRTFRNKRSKMEFHGNMTTYIEREITIMSFFLIFSPLYVSFHLPFICPHFYLFFLAFALFFLSLFDLCMFVFTTSFHFFNYFLPFRFASLFMWKQYWIFLVFMRKQYWIFLVLQYFSLFLSQ